MTFLARLSARSRTNLVLLLALSIVYLLAGFFLAPALLRRTLIGRTERLLHLRPALQTVRVNPLALSVTLRGFQLNGQDGAPLVGFDELYLDFSPFGSLRHRAWSFSRIRLQSPVVHAEIRADRTLNLTQLVPPPAPGKPLPSGGTAAEKPLPPVWVGQLALLDGRVPFRDLSHGPAIETAMLPVRLVLTQFSTKREANNAYTFAAVSQAGEKIGWEGNFNLLPFRSEGRFSLGNVQLSTLDNYLRDILAFQAVRGSFDLEANYRLDASTVPVGFELGAGSLTARDVALADRGSQEPLITIPELVLRDVSASAGRREIVVGNARAAHGKIVAWVQPDGKVNLEKWGTTPPTATPAVPAPVWVVRIPDFAVTDYSLVAEDRKLPQPAHLELHQIDLAVQDYSTSPGSRCRAQGTCTIDSSGSVAVEGEMGFKPPVSDLQLHIRNADLRLLQPYVNAAAKLDIARGTADVEGRLQLDMEAKAGPQSRFTGAVTARRLRVTDRVLHQDFLRWETLHLGGVRSEAKPDFLNVDEIVATRAYARVVVGPDRRTNIQNAMLASTAVDSTGVQGASADAAAAAVVVAGGDLLSAAAAPAAKAPIPARIGLVRIVDSAAYFADLSLTPAFATGIEQLNGSVTGLSSEKLTRATVQIDGKVDKYAPVSISGEVNLLSGVPYTDLALRFEGIELTSFTPYSGRFAGYTIERGKLNLDLKYVVENRQLQGENKIFLDQLTLGSKTGSPDATSLPIRFAIALLKDRNGNIDLDVPVEGSLDDPHFSIMRIVWKVLKNLIVKAVTSPFKLIGALVGGEDKELGHVEFVAGTDSLTAETRSRLDALRKGLIEKQELRLEVAQAIDRQRDSAALARAQLGNQLAVARGEELRKAGRPVPAADEIGLGPEDSLRILTQLYTQSYGPPPGAAAPPQGKRPPETPEQQAARLVAEVQQRQEMAARLLADVAVDPTAMQQLGLQRAQNVRDCLLQSGEIAPARVFIVQTPVTPATAGDLVRLDFALGVE